VLFRLLADADVLVENFKAGTLERWGLGFADVLQARFPRLVHCTITGFGVDGPWGGMPGYDLFVQAWSGMISMNGSIESGPFRISVPLVDLATGTNAALGVMMALRRREATGRGQHVEVALFDVALSLLVPAAQLHFIAGAAPGLAGNRHGSIAPFSLHKTRGRSIFLSAGSDRAFRNLCSILGKPQLGADPRFLTNRDRLDNVEALTAELDDGMAERDGEELALELMAKGVGAGALFTVADALDHPHTEHREMVVDVDGQKTLGVPIRLSESPGSARARPPAFNEHVDDILQELGFSADEAADLQRSNAVSGSTAHAPD
jgi:formyl-CoA transferase